MNIREFRQAIADAWLAGLHYSCQSAASDHEIARASLDGTQESGVQQIIAKEMNQYATKKVIEFRDKLESMQ